MTSNFIPGLELSSSFYREVVKPILELNFPGIPYSAALLGAGSEVLGFDTEMSRDHDWGPRVKLFLNEEDFAGKTKEMKEVLKNRLPHQFRGYPVPWTIVGPSGYTSVEIHTIWSFFLEYLKFDIREEIKLADWLTFPEQKLRAIISGAVYRDDLGVETSRKRFQYYPHDIWLYLLASQWQRIGQEEHLMGRAGIVGDEIGSAILATRLVRDLMRLCFLIERQYPPYAKWFGTAFAQLPGTEPLLHLFRRVLMASSWSERQEYLVPAYEMLASKHNDLQITTVLDPKASYFYDRPFLVIDGGRFVEAIRDQIHDLGVKRIADRWLIGNVDQFSDSTDLLNEARSLRFIYE